MVDQALAQQQREGDTYRHGEDSRSPPRQSPPNPVCVAQVRIGCSSAVPQPSTRGSFCGRPLLFPKSLQLLMSDFIAGVAGLAIPAHGLRFIFGQPTFAPLVRPSKKKHAIRITGVGSLAKPDHGLRVVFRQPTSPVLIHKTKINHTIRTAGAGGFAKPVHCLCVVFGQSTSPVLESPSDKKHCRRITSGAGLAIPAHGLSGIRWQPTAPTVVHHSQIAHGL